MNNLTLLATDIVPIGGELPSYDWLHDDEPRMVVANRSWASVWLNQPLGELTTVGNYATTVTAGYVGEFYHFANDWTNVRLDVVVDGLASDNFGGYVDIGQAGDYSLYDQVGGSTWFGTVTGNVRVEGVENHYVGSNDADGSEWNIEGSVDVRVSLYSFEEGELDVEDVEGFSLYVSGADGADFDIEDVDRGRVSVWGDELTIEVSDSSLDSLDIGGEDVYGDIWGSEIGDLYVIGEDTFVFVGDSRVDDGFVGQGAQVYLSDSFANLNLGNDTEVTAHDSRVILDLYGNNEVELRGGQALVDASNNWQDEIELSGGVTADIAADSFDTISFGTTSWSVDELRGDAEASEQTYHQFGDVEFTLTTSQDGYYIG